MKKWSRALYQPNRPLTEAGYVTASNAHIALSGQAAAEGMVLLKNENHVLPLDKGAKIAAFGKGLVDMVKGGGGSGDVYTPFVTTLAQGLTQEGAQLFEPLVSFYEKDIREQYDAGAAPGMTKEPELPADLLTHAAAWTDTALLCISRFSGEGWDRVSPDFDDPEAHLWGEEATLPQVAARIFPDGDFYLTREEKQLAATLTDTFAHVIAVLNVGGVVDTAWIQDTDAIDGALLMWQGGMDGGRAAAKLLFGAANPCGRLPDTFARTLEDYPSTQGFHDSPDYVAYTEDIYVGYRYFETIPGEADKVVYPFGYGLSYTQFTQEVLEAEETDGTSPYDICAFGVSAEDALSFPIRVTNVGSMPGKEVTAIYYSAPQGKLGRPARELGAFAKTKLLAPGESETLVLTIPKRQLAAFDDTGKICRCANVLEQGTYRFFLGSCVRTAVLMEETFEVPGDLVLEQLSDALRPNALPQRLLPDGSMEALETGDIPDMNENILPRQTPEEQEGILPAKAGRERCRIDHVEKAGTLPLIEVAEGRLPMEAFLAQLSDEELIRLLGGAPSTGVANTCGIGGLEEYGIPAAMTADGPAGIRIHPDCGIATTAWPCETLLASTWDPELLYAVGKAAGEELKENNLQIWLAPAMNIHRSPLCGRNFEYYSEDPVLTGVLAAAQVKGIQSNGVAACIKHFAANNKETNRKHSDSRVSLRALREIYLRGFEIVVKTANPWTIMSSYNAINGRRASESKELLTTILREEWGFGGMVTTDWWNRAEQYKEVLAGNDVKMGCGFDERVKLAMERGALKREDLLLCAKRVLELICKLD